MRNIRALAMVVVSLIAGFAALSLASKWLSAQSVASTNGVVVAAVDVPAGQVIGEQHLRVIEWPVGSVPSGAFKETSLVAGRVTKSTISTDEPVLEGRLAAAGAKGGMAALIKDGKRAITVRVNDVVGVAGFALPGTFVDIMVNIDERRRAKGTTVSKIVLERILVLGIGQEASRDETQPKVVKAVTLEVTPGEAEKIDLARSVGTLSLVLRNHVDSDPIKTAGATPDALLGILPQDKPVVRRVVRRAEVNNPQPKRMCVDSWDGATYKAECF